MSSAEFVTFWHGPLTPMTSACLASFPAHGARLALYAYDSTIDPPEGVEWIDARRVCPDISLLGRFLVGGTPSIAVFSDYFRYLLLQQTGACWVDADILCLKRPNFGRAPLVWGRQPEAHGKALINNAVLKFPRDHEALARMRALAEGAIDQNLSWGAIGPFALTGIAESLGVYATSREPFEFYPIDPDSFWLPLLRRCREEVEALVARSQFLHLWSELLRRCDYDPWVCPPEGSYLHEAFGRLGILDRFTRVYGEAEMEAMLTNWTSRPAS